MSKLIKRVEQYLANLFGYTVMTTTMKGQLWFRHVWTYNRAMEIMKLQSPVAVQTVIFQGIAQQEIARRRKF